METIPVGGLPVKCHFVFSRAPKAEQISAIFFSLRLHLDLPDALALFL
jgi:hypothetical protein